MYCFGQTCLSLSLCSPSKTTWGCNIHAISIRKLLFFVNNIIPFFSSNKHYYPVSKTHFFFAKIQFLDCIFYLNYPTSGRDYFWLLSPCNQVLCLLLILSMMKGYVHRPAADDQAISCFLYRGARTCSFKLCGKKNCHDSTFHNHHELIRQKRSL